MKFGVAGAEIEYDVRGEGDALVLLHAFPLGMAMWDPQVEELSRTFRVIRFDARGFGHSLHAEGALTMERIADDAAALLDHLKIERAALCGLSMGGYAAFAFVRRHARRVKALVLADTRAGADSDEARLGRAALADKVRREGATAILDAMLPKLVGTTTHAQRPAVIARVRELVMNQTPRGIADALAGLAARADSGPTLGEIQAPTLVLCGEEDVVTPIAEAERLQRDIAGAQLARIPQAGHLSSLEQPQLFNARVAEFLATLR